MQRTEKKKWKILLILSVTLCMSLSGCGILGSSGKKISSDTGDENTVRIALITGEDGTGDPRYKLAWDGLLKAEQSLKVSLGYEKISSDKDYPSKLTELSAQKYEIIFTIGPNAVASVIEAAKKNPDIRYICLESRLDSPIPNNVLAVSYKVEEAAFLAGYLAGKMTQSNVVGFISGDNKDPAQSYYYGFKAGVRYGNAGCGMMKGNAGTFSNNSRVEEMAKRMVESKADVILQAAGSAGEGVIKAMEKSDKYAMGSDVDQNYLAPQSVLTSVIINNDQVVYDIIDQFMESNLVLGKNIEYGLAEKGVALAETTKEMIPENVYNQMIQIQQKIIEGKMSIPSNENEYLNFTGN